MTDEFIVQMKPLRRRLIYPIKMPRILWTLWVTLLVLNTLDAYTTHLAFERGMKEANPLLKGWTIDQIYGAKLLVVGIIAYLLLRYMDRIKSPLVPTAMFLATIAYALVVGFNLGGLTT
jgi:hypothetical protein